MTPALPKALLVDDEAGPRKSLTWILRSRRIAESIECATADEALVALSKIPDIAVAIVDLRMPKMLGTELAERIKTLRPNIPIILYTGYNDLPDGEGKRLLGLRLFWAIIEKPGLGNDHTAAIVSAAIKNEPPPSAPT